MHPFVHSDGLGGFFALWWDGVSRLQHVDASGGIASGWPSQGKLVTPASTADLNQLIGSDNGRVITSVYDADSSSYRLQKYSQSGMPLWAGTGTRVCWTHASANDDYIAVALPDGGAMVAWKQAHYPAMLLDDIWAMRLDSLGHRVWSQDLPLCDAPGPQRYLRGVLSSDTTVIFTWSDARRGSSPPFGNWDQYAQKLSIAGAELWGHNGRRVRTDPKSTSLGDLLNVGDGIAPDHHGGAFVLFTDDSIDATGDVTLVRIDSTGSMATGWPDAGLSIDSVGHGAAALPIISVGADGGAVVAWIRGSGYWSLRAQKVTAEGQHLWGLLGIALTDTSLAGTLSVAADGEGGMYFLNAVGNYGGLPRDAYLQHLSSQGALLWPGTGILCVQRKTSIFPVIRPDSSGGAFICWEDYQASQSRILAQHVNADGTLGGDVVDALLSLASADATPGGARLRWYTSERSITGADLERNMDETGWAPLARVTPDGTGTLAYDDRDVTPGHRYGYRLLVQFGGATTPMGEAWVTIPATATFALRGVQPNPSEGELTVALSLPDAAPARLEVFDVSGRRVASRDVGTLGAGMHLVRFARPDALLRPGVYAVRLVRADRTLSARAVVVR